MGTPKYGILASVRCMDPSQQHKQKETPLNVLRNMTAGRGNILPCIVNYNVCDETPLPADPPTPLFCPVSFR